MPLDQNHPLLNDAKELHAKVSDWQKEEAMVKGRDRMAVALRMADYSHPIFQDSKYPEYALLALDMDAITEAQFTTVMSLWAANQDFQPQIVEHKIISADPFTPENKILRQFLTFSIEDDNQKNQMTDKEFRTFLQKITAENVPLSEKVYFTFQLPGKFDDRYIVHAIKNLGFKAFMPIKLIDQKNEPDLFIIPSLTLVQTFIDNFSTRALRLRPVIGQTSQQGVLNNHESDEHPLGISFPDFIHLFADKFKSGAFGFILHDYYHALLLMRNPIRAAFNRAAHLAQDFKRQHPDDAVLIDAMIERLTDQEFRNFYETKDTDAQDDLDNSENFFMNMFQFFMLPGAVLLDEDAKAGLESLSHEWQSQRKEGEFMFDIATIQTFSAKIAKKVLIDAKPAPIVFKFFRFIMADVINQQALWHKSFGITAAGFYQVVKSSNEHLRNALVMESFEKENDALGSLFPNQYSDKRQTIELAEKFCTMLANDLNTRFLEDEKARAEMLTPAGCQWVEEHLQVEAMCVAAIRENDKTKLIDAMNRPNHKVNRAFDTLKVYLILCIEQNAHACLAYLLEEAKALDDIVGERRLVKIDNQPLMLGDRLLHLAAKRGNTQAVTLLCHKLDNTEKYDLDKRTPLDYCLVNGDTLAASACLRKSFAEKKYLTYLQRERSLPESSNLLIASYFQFQSDVSKAIRSGKIKRIAAVFASTAHFDINTPLGRYDQDHDHDYEKDELVFQTSRRSQYVRPLHLLFWHLRLHSDYDRSLVAAFKELGADPSQTDGSGRTVAEFFVYEASQRQLFSSLFPINENLIAKDLNLLQQEESVSKAQLGVLNAWRTNDVAELKRNIAILPHDSFQNSSFMIELINTLKQKKWNSPAECACLEALLQADCGLNQPHLVNLHGERTQITLWKQLLMATEENGLQMTIAVRELCIRYGADVDQAVEYSSDIFAFIFAKWGRRYSPRLLDCAIREYFAENANKSVILAHIQLLLREGANPNYLFRRKVGDSEQRYLSPLKMAVEKGDINLAIILLSFGADPNHSQHQFCSAIECAKELSNEPMLNVLENYHRKPREQALPPYALSVVKPGQYRKLMADEKDKTPIQACERLQDQLNQLAVSIETYCHFSDDEFDALYELAKSVSADCKPVLFGKAVAEFMSKLAELKLKVALPKLQELKEKVRLLHEELELGGGVAMTGVSQLRIACATELQKITQILKDLQSPKELALLRDKSDDLDSEQADLVRKLSIAPKSILFQMAPELERDVKGQVDYRAVSSCSSFTKK